MITVSRDFFNSTLLYLPSIYYIQINSAIFEMYLIAKTLRLQVELILKYIFFLRHKRNIDKRYFSLFQLFQNPKICPYVKIIVICRRNFFSFLFFFYHPTTNIRISQLLIVNNFNWSIQPWSIVQGEIFSTKFHKLFLTCLIIHSNFFIN